MDYYRYYYYYLYYYFTRPYGVTHRARTAGSAVRSENDSRSTDDATANTIIIYIIRTRISPVRAVLPTRRQRRRHRRAFLLGYPTGRRRWRRCRRVIRTTGDADTLWRRRRQPFVVVVDVSPRPSPPVVNVIYHIAYTAVSRGKARYARPRFPDRRTKPVASDFRPTHEPTTF